MKNCVVYLCLKSTEYSEQKKEYESIVTINQQSIIKGIRDIITSSMYYHISSIKE